MGCNQEGLALAAKIALDSVYKVTAKGRDYYYAWRGPGAPRLGGEPGSEQFVRELAQALAGRNMGEQGTLRALCIRWKRSPAWAAQPGEGGLAVSTRKNWRPFLDDIEDHFGPLSIAQFASARWATIRPRIKAWRNKWREHPRQADMAKQVLSSMLSFAVDEDLLDANPCLGMKNLYSNDRSDRIWEPVDLDRLEKAAPPHVMRAARLAGLTGLRQSDLLRLNWSHVGDLAIEIKTGKSAEQKTTLIPIYGELAEHLASIPKVSTRVLVNSDGVPWQSGFTSSWNKALIAAGFKDKAGQVDADLHFHDLRGTAATRMHLGGLTDEEIAEIMTWSVDQVGRLIKRYVKRNALLRDRIRRMDEARQRPPVNGSGT